MGKYIYGVFRIVNSTSRSYLNTRNKVELLFNDISANNSRSACEIAVKRIKRKYDGNVPIDELVAYQKQEIGDK